MPFKLAVILLCFNWFVFLTLNFFGGTIRTESTLVNTDDIIDSADKLIGTRRVWVRHFDNEEKIRNAPERSLFAKLRKKKAIVIGEPNRNQIEELIKPLSSHVYFDEAVSVLFNFIVLEPHAQMMNLVAFFKAANLYETLSVVFMRKSLDGERKKFVAQRFLFDRLLTKQKS